MRAVVIGGTGFLGGAIVEELVRRGHDTHAVSPSAPPIGSGRLHLHPGDLSHPGTLVHLLDGADVVVLAAGRTVPGNARLVAVDELAAQVDGSLAIIDGLAERSPDARLVYVSSAGGLSPGTPVFAEGDRPRPWSTYGALKLSVEAFIEARDHELDRRSLIIRPTNPYGPGQRLDKPQGFIAQACAAVLAGRPVELWDDPTTRRDWLFVDDFAECIVTAIEVGLSGPLHVAAGEEHSLDEVVRSISRVAGVDVATVAVPRDGVANPASLAVSNERARRELGWSPTVSLHDGIDRLWRHLVGDAPDRSGIDVREPLRR